MNREDVAQELLDLGRHYRSADEHAKAIGISAGYLSRIYRGLVSPGPKVLRYLNMEKIETETVVYRRKPTGGHHDASKRMTKEGDET